MDPRWRIELLGGLRARLGDQVAPLRKQRQAVLLAYLAYHDQHPQPRELLAELLWPESEAEDGRAKLRVILHFLRQLLEPPGFEPGAVLIADSATLHLNRAALTPDAAHFPTALPHAP